MAKPSITKTRALDQLVDPETLYKHYIKAFPTAVLRNVPTGSIALDYVFGGGFPLGKVILFTSPPGIGKSLTCLFLSGRILEEEPESLVIYADAECGLVPALIQNVLKKDYGNRFLHISPHSYEDVEEVIKKYMETGKLAAVFIDSVTSLFPKDVLEGEKMPIGAKANAENMFCLRMKVFSSIHKFGIVYVNQHRAKIDTMHGNKGGPKPAGGWALQFYNDLSMIMRPAFFLYNSADDKVGACVHIVQEKNRMVGNRSAYLFLKYGHGVSNLATMASVLKYTGYAKQGGTYFDIDIPDLSIKEKVKGNAGLDQFVVDNFDKLMAYLDKQGKFVDYFENFKP